MPADDLPDQDLDALRREIDEIDDRLHDQLIQRAETLQRIAAAKAAMADGGVGASVYVHTGREANVLRRRLARHRGPLPAAVVARIWREMIGASDQIQSPVRVLVHAPAKSVGYWDLARNHFGSVARMSMHVSAQRVLTEIAEGADAVGLLALPEEDDPDPWWTHILGGEEARVQVIARLPFFASATGQFEDLATLVVARFGPERSGDDVSLLAAETTDLSRARLLGLLEQAGLPARFLASHGGENGAARLHLVEIDGYVNKTDARIEALSQSAAPDVERVVALGAYARPIGQLD